MNKKNLFYSTKCTRALKGTGNCAFYEHLPFKYKVKLYKLFIKGKYEAGDLLYISYSSKGSMRLVICYI
jgi:hypothetical protein